MNGSARWFTVASMALALAGCGFTGNLRMDPGFASFRTPSTLPGMDREVAVSLGPVPVRLATMISRPMFKDDEPWITDTLAAIRAVRVYSYDVDGDPEVVARHLETTRGKLLDDGWRSIAAVREDGGLVAALVRNREREPDTIRGLAVLLQDDGELTLVNIIGDLEPETFNRVMEGLDIEVPFVTFGS